MKAVIQKVSIPDDWRDNMLAELDREKTSIQNEGVSFIQNLKTRKAEIEQRIDRLLDIYIEGKGISPDEYQVKKAKLLGEKADIDQEIRDFVQKGNNWLEPMREVILLSSQAKILLSQGDKTQIRAFLQNVGSNFMLNSKRLEISPKNGWRARVAGEPMTPFLTGGGGGIRTHGAGVCPLNRLAGGYLRPTRSPLRSCSILTYATSSRASQKIREAPIQAPP